MSYLYQIKMEAGKKQNVVKHIININLWYFCKNGLINSFELNRFLTKLHMIINAPTKNKFSKNLNSKVKS